MRLKSILLFTAILTAPFSAFAAEPERELQSGLNYTTFGYDDQKEETKDKATDKGPEAPAAPQAPQKAAVAKPQKPTLTPQQNPEEEQSAEVRIWNKYKALASGQSQKPEEETTAKEDGKTKFEKADASTAESKEGKGAMKSWHAPETEKDEAQPQEEAKQVSGISAILNEWQTSKNQQREMRTKHFAVPEGIGTNNKEKPEETPKQP